MAAAEGAGVSSKQELLGAKAPLMVGIDAVFGEWRVAYSHNLSYLTKFPSNLLEQERKASYLIC